MILCVCVCVCYVRRITKKKKCELNPKPLGFYDYPIVAAMKKKKKMKEGVATKEELDEIKGFVLSSYEKDFEASKTWESAGDDWLSSKWSGFKSPRQLSRVRQTGVDVKVLRSIG
ncbi:unnamed protein product, partial [Discosporangium mesarthrocarpum]